MQIAQPGSLHRVIVPLCSSVHTRRPAPTHMWQTFPRGSAGLTPSNTVQRPYAVRTSYVSRCEFMYVPSAEVRDDEARVLEEKQRVSLDVCWVRR